MVAKQKPTAKPTIPVTTTNINAVTISNEATVKGLFRKWRDSTQSIHHWARPIATIKDHKRCISAAKDPSTNPVF